jgi:hypothetical protein
MGYTRARIYRLKNPKNQIAPTKRASEKVEEADSSRAIDDCEDSARKSGGRAWL